MYPSDPHSYPVLFMNICKGTCIVNHLYNIPLGIKNVRWKWKQIAVCRWNFITEWVADVTNIEFIYVVGDDVFLHTTDILYSVQED